MMHNPVDIEILINETRNLVKHRDLFDEVAGNLNTLDLTYQLRISKWLSFFNRNYSKNVCIYSYSVYALIEAIEENKLFKTQTEYEFEISIDFYKKIFSANFFISIENIEYAKQLLNISLILGKYPGMQIRSAYKAIGLLINGVGANTLNQVFEYLFVKYENPKILTYNLNNLNIVEIDILMFILQGNNIRNHPNIPFPISKKESYILINKIPPLKFSDNVIERSIATSKLIMASNNTNFLYGFFTYNKIFIFKIKTFLEDIDFWCDVYNLLLKVEWDYAYLSIQEFIDYFGFVKYHANKNFSLKGRSLNSIYNAIFNWHEDVDFENQKELIYLSWQGNSTKEYKIFIDDEKYLFNEITNGEELYRESDEMKHCAFSYIDLCFENYCSIWSMKKEINSSFKHYITIEVQNKKIVQIAGKRNRKPNKKDKKIIREWAKETEFTFSTLELY
jgi:hypothetical protein